MVVFGMLCIIERALREVRRRTRPMSCFNHDQSIERIVYAVVINHPKLFWGRNSGESHRQKTHKRVFYWGKERDNINCTICTQKLIFQS
jgi:transposase-like protein